MGDYSYRRGVLVEALGWLDRAGPLRSNVQRASMAMVKLNREDFPGGPAREAYDELMQKLATHGPVSETLERFSAGDLSEVESAIRRLAAIQG